MQSVTPCNPCESSAAILLRMGVQRALFHFGGPRQMRFTRHAIGDGQARIICGA